MKIVFVNLKEEETKIKKKKKMDADDETIFNPEIKEEDEEEQIPEYRGELGVEKIEISSTTTTVPKQKEILSSLPRKSRSLEEITEEARKEFLDLWPKAQDDKERILRLNSSHLVIDYTITRERHDSVEFPSLSSSVPIIGTPKIKTPSRISRKSAPVKFATMRDTRPKKNSNEDEPDSSKLLKRSNSLDMNKSFDTIPYWVHWRKKKKDPNRPKKNVRFDGNFFPTKEIFEINMATFNSIPFQEIRDPSKSKEGLVFEKEDGKDIIVAGTIEKLVSILADSGLQNFDYIKTFLYSYRSIIGPMKLITMLIERFEFPLPENATPEEEEIHKKYSVPMKLRVINVLKKWLTNHFYDFQDEKRVLNKLNHFIKEKATKSLDNRWPLQLQLIVQNKHEIPYPLNKDSALELIEATMRRPDSGLTFKKFNFKKEYFNMCFWGHDFEAWLMAVTNCGAQNSFDIANRMLKESHFSVLDTKEKGDFKKTLVYRLPNKPVVTTPKTFAPQLIPEPVRFNDINIIELARQLTLISQDIFLRINAREYSEFMKANGELKAYLCPWTDVMVQRVQAVAGWTASEIVLTINLDQRVETIKKFIQVAKQCQKFQNFSDTVAIIQGLQHSGVERLLRTWKSVPKKFMKLFQELKAQTEESALRTMMTNAQLPLVPHLESYLLEMKELAKLPYVLPNGMVNFKKLRMEAKLFEEMERPKNGLKIYFKPIQRYIDFLNEEWTVLKDREIMKYSLKCEIKRSEDSGVFEPRPQLRRTSSRDQGGEEDQ